MRRFPLLLIVCGLTAVIVGSAGLLFAGQLTPPTFASLATASPIGSPAATPSSAQQSMRPALLPSAAPANPGNQAATSKAVALISIPKIGIDRAPVYERGTDKKGTMLIAPGYGVTHYAFSAPFGNGNAVLYGHDDIQGSIFSHLYDLSPGDIISITVHGRTQQYRVTGHQVVPPTAVQVMSPTQDVRLTVITCWPFNVDTKRWIVTAVLA